MPVVLTTEAYVEGEPRTGSAAPCSFPLSAGPGDFDIESGLRPLTCTAPVVPYGAPPRRAPDGLPSQHLV